MSLKNSYYWNTDYPNMRIDVSYSQTARTGTSATYKVTMAVYFTSSGWHGYGLSAKCTINGAAQQLRIKEPSNSWSGSGHKGTWTFNITASAGTGGGTLPASIQLWGTEGDTTNINSGSKTVSLSTWNTAPTWTSDDANVNGWKEHKTIPENTGAVTVNLPSASDKEGNTIKYDVYRYVNGASNSKIATGTTSRSISDNISGFGQGAQIKYLVKCNDGSLWASGDRWSWTYTKNTFTPASISTSNRIGYGTTSITLNVSGAKNTNGNTSFTYRLSNTSGLTIHNSTFTPNSSGQVSFGIYNGSGSRPSTPHIDLSQLKEYTAKGTYQGTLVLRLTTSNAYGSVDHRDVSIPIDLRTNPVPATIANPTGAITVAGGSYFIYNRSTVNVSWSGASDKLNVGALSYELYYKYGSGSWNRLTSTTGTSWSGTLPQVTAATTCYFKVVATTSYGYSATSAEKSITIHYYNKPKVSYSAPNRTTSEFSVVIASATDTSITAVAISSRSYVGLAGTSKTFSGASTTIKDTGLTGDSTYNLVVTVTDNSGLSGSTATLNVPVAAYIPIMSITNKGISINATADPAYKLNIGGSLKVSDAISSAGGRFNHGGSTIIRSNGNSTIISCIGGYMYLRPNGDTNSNGQVTIDLSGTLNAPNLQVGGNNVYHTGRKPTIGDLSAMGCYFGSDEGEYYGIRGRNNSNNEWIRSTKQGFIPFSNGVGALGTSGWRFSSVFANTIDAASVVKASSTQLTRDNLVFADNSNWKSVDFSRTIGGATYSARFGIGGNAGGPSPSIEFHTNGTQNNLKSRMDLNASSIALLSFQTDQSMWVGIFSGGNTTAHRQGYFGRGSNGNNNVNVIAEKANLLLRSSYASSGHGVTLDTGGYMRPEQTNGWACGHPSYRWSTVYYTNLNSASDGRLKANIKYLESSPNARTRSEENITELDLYDFVKSDLKLAKYDYIPSILTSGVESDRMTGKLGFIAQDIVDSKVGSTIIHKDIIEVPTQVGGDIPDREDEVIHIPALLSEGEETLSYDLTDYVNVLAGALKVSISKIENLSMENEELKKRLALIEDKLGLQ